MKKGIGQQFSIVLGLALLSGNSIAGPFNGIHPLQSDRFSIGLGGYNPDISGDYSIDNPNGGQGSDIDFDDVGLDDSDVLPAVGLIWRLSNKSRLQGEYFRLSTSGNESVTEAIKIGDLELEVGGKVDSDADMDIGRVFWGYSFVKNDAAELGAGLGLHYIDLDVSVAGSGTINGIEVVKAERSVDDWAVLPNIGGYANYAFSPKWLVGGRIDWISANIGDYDGTLWNAEAFAQYQLFEHFGVGLAYRYLDFELSKDDSKNGDWEVTVDFNGPMLFFTANF